MSPKLSVIVVSYKGRDYLDRCLRSIFESAVPEDDLEVILVDNASGDGSAEFVKSNFPNVKVLRNKFNYGFATANNQGFDLSSGEYVMGLNPDAEIVGNSLETAIKFLDDNPGFGIVSPCLIQEGKTVVIYDDYPILPKSRLLTRLGMGNARSYSVVPSGFKEVSWIWGTGYICRRSALGNFFFDDRTFLFAEEQEICTRVRRAGFKIGVLSNFLITHVGSVSYGRDKEKSALARRLLESACWMHRRDRLGLVLADTHQFLRGFDDFTMLLALSVKDLISDSNPGRELEMANLKANVRASLGLLFRGEAYFRKVNDEARRYFNGGIEIPYPPETI